MLRAPEVGDRSRLIASAPLLRWYRAGEPDPCIEADVEAWYRYRNLPVRPGTDRLGVLLALYPEFRNLFYYRLAARGQVLVAALSRRLLKPMPALEIACPDIGPGLVISHGHGTILAARSIGAECWIHHQVTLGWSYGKRAGIPMLGERVFVGAGAKVLGQITVGAGARIGANSVVLVDVPPGATVVGVPARIVPTSDAPSHL